MRKNYILVLCLGLLLVLAGCGNNKENSVETIEGGGGCQWASIAC